MTKLAPEMMTYDDTEILFPNDDRSSIGTEMVSNASPESRRTVLGIVAVNQRAIDYCDGCIDGRPTPKPGWDMCAREALRDSVEQNGTMAAATLRACVSCAEITRQGGKTPSHGLWPKAT